MADEQHDQRSEQPTPRRRQQAAEQGDAPRSRDLSAVAVMGAGAAAAAFAGGGIAGGLLDFCARALGHLDAPPADLARQAAAVYASAAGPVLAGTAAAAIVAGAAQAGGALSLRMPRFELERLEPLRNLRQRMLSAEALLELGKSIAKVVVIGGLAAHLVWGSVPDLLRLPWMDARGALAAIAGLCASLAVRLGLALCAVAAIDYAAQRLLHERRLRMTRQEVRDELRREEGDPQVRRRQRQRQREAARRRMMAEVPRADVVLVNPTEYAVALRYRRGRMAAPRVVAKGRRRVAERIRELARRAGVPVVANPPLARALCAVPLGREIPAALYRAVAEVLAFVYRIRGRRAAA